MAHSCPLFSGTAGEEVEYVNREGALDTAKSVPLPAIRCVSVNKVRIKAGGGPTAEVARHDQGLIGGGGNV